MGLQCTGCGGWPSGEVVYRAQSTRAAAPTAASAASAFTPREDAALLVWDGAAAEVEVTVALADADALLAGAVDVAAGALLLRVTPFERTKVRTGCRGSRWGTYHCLASTLRGRLGRLEVAAGAGAGDTGGGAVDEGGALAETRVVLGVAGAEVCARKAGEGARCHKGAQSGSA